MGDKSATLDYLNQNYPGQVPKIGGKWDSGQPYLDLSNKRLRKDVSSNGGGVQLILKQLDVSAFKVGSRTCSN